MRVGYDDQAQISVNVNERPEQSRSATYGTCGLKGIQLGWHKGSNWHRFPALVSEAVLNIAKAGNCCFVSPVNICLFL